MQRVISEIRHTGEVLFNCISSVSMCVMTPLRVCTAALAVSGHPIIAY